LRGCFVLDGQKGSTPLLPPTPCFLRCLVRVARVSALLV
jgi:hypothetical protein